ncbi:MAG TPA: glycolate oxidase subunit GlcF, partial [Usitatibacter sp.]|nr:glycolate oxidase subunit GlcF [Usitatibacter sp.]
RQRGLRWLLRRALPKRSLFGAALALARIAKPLLPAALARKIPSARPAGAWPVGQHARKMLTLAGCVQPAIAPGINAASARLLDRIGISLLEVSAARCCGAISFHLNAHDEALDYVRANIDAWWPQVEAGAEAIVITASGCGTMVAEYGHLLRDDPAYAAKAARVSALAKDISVVVAGERDALMAQVRRGLAEPKIAFHSPCSLQHGLKITGVVESILREAGFALTAVPDAHLCCGSAGTYSILQPELSQRLLHDKVEALESGAPQSIATANIGCLAHIGSGSARPVRHWIELLEERLV